KKEKEKQKTESKALFAFGRIVLSITDGEAPAIHCDESSSAKQETQQLRLERSPYLKLNKTFMILCLYDYKWRREARNGGFEMCNNFYPNVIMLVSGGFIPFGVIGLRWGFAEGLKSSSTNSWTLQCLTTTSSDSKGWNTPPPMIVAGQSSTTTFGDSTDEPATTNSSDNRH
uniref:Uncharacterized protein n=1 Tax=Cucumis melo TaxID=3656 RepID=A0A9I9EA35_CUCME